VNGTDIGQIVAATIISAGGIGGIIIAAIRFSSNIIAERLSKRYELKLNKTIENYKTHLEKGNYISRAMFDKEFEYYQLLSRKYTIAFNSFNLYYGIKYSKLDVIPIDEINIYNPKLEELAKDIKGGKKVTEVQMDTLKSNIAEQFLEFKKVLDESESFIDGEIYSEYAKLYNLIRSYYLNEDSMLLDEIQSLRLQLPKTIRNYLIGLTVIN
jgi:hypothetical protein